MFDTVFVTSRQDFRGFDREDDAKNPHPEQAPVLDEAARVKITQLRNVTEVEPEIRVMGEIVCGRRNPFRVRDRLADVGARERSLRQPERQVLLQQQRRRSDSADRFRQGAEPEESRRS